VQKVKPKGAPDLGRKGLMVCASGLLFAASCFYRALNVADEGAAMCRGRPTAFNSPVVGRSVATIGEVALVVQVCVASNSESTEHACTLSPTKESLSHTEKIKAGHEPTASHDTAFRRTWNIYITVESYTSCRIVVHGVPTPSPPPPPSLNETRRYHCTLKALVCASGQRVGCGRLSFTRTPRCHSQQSDQFWLQKQ
jgi:hypothetical protein